MSFARELVLYAELSQVLVVTLDRSEIMGRYNTPDTAVRDR